MAKVTLTRRWATGDEVTAAVKVDESYPQSLSQARAEAKRAFAEACDVVLTEDAEPDVLPALPTEIPGVDKNNGWGSEGN